LISVRHFINICVKNMDKLFTSRVKSCIILIMEDKICPEDIVVTVESDEEVKHCYRHPDVETKISCGSCGRHLCPDCVHMGPVGVRCERCYYGYDDKDEAENSVITDGSSVKKTTFMVSFIVAAIFVILIYLFNLAFYEEYNVARYSVISAALYGMIVGIIVRARFKRRNTDVVKWAMRFVMVFTFLTGVSLVLIFGHPESLVKNLLLNTIAQIFLATGMTYMFGMRKGKDRR